MLAALVGALADLIVAVCGAGVAPGLGAPPPRAHASPGLALCMVTIMPETYTFPAYNSMLHKVPGTRAPPEHHCRILVFLAKPVAAQGAAQGQLPTQQWVETGFRDAHQE